MCWGKEKGHTNGIYNIDCIDKIVKVLHGRKILFIYKIFNLTFNTFVH